VITGSGAGAPRLRVGRGPDPGPPSHEP